jgi:hypothetical protein
MNIPVDLPSVKRRGRPRKSKSVAGVCSVHSSY